MVNPWMRIDSNATPKVMETNSSRLGKLCGRLSTSTMGSATTARTIDVDVANYYVSTHPDSWFTWQPIIVKRAPGAIASILGRTHTVTRPGHVKTRSQLTDKEFAAALTEEFGLTLTSDELDVLVKAPTGHSEKSVLGTAPGT